MSENGGYLTITIITVNACGNAAGVKLPPFILYKGKHLHNTWIQLVRAMGSAHLGGWKRSTTLNGLSSSSIQQFYQGSPQNRPSGIVLWWPFFPHKG